MRFVSSQLLASLEDDLWLHLAGYANRQAAKFAAAVEQHGSAALEYPAEANEVFVRWTGDGFKALEDAGIQFLMWPDPGHLARFVFAHSTDERATDRLCEVLSKTP